MWLVVRSRNRATPPHYANTEREYERDYQETLPQGRKAADGCRSPVTAVAIGSGSVALVGLYRAKAEWGALSGNVEGSPKSE